MTAVRRIERPCAEIPVLLVGPRIALPDRRVAVLGDGAELPFDLYLGVPVHRAPEVVVESGLTEDGWIAETGQIDSSYIKAHRSAGGAKGGREPMPLASRVVGGQRRSMPLSIFLDGRFASS